jgi:hypothetical protein
MSKIDTILDFNDKVIKVKYMDDKSKSVEIKPVTPTIEACRPSCNKEKKTETRSGSRISKNRKK